MKIGQIILALGILVVGACGGSSELSTTRTPFPTRTRVPDTPTQRPNSTPNTPTQPPATPTTTNTAGPTVTGTPPTATPTSTIDPNVTPATATPTVRPGSAIFVRADVGDDANDGRSPGAAMRTISAALLALPNLTSGRTLIVGPGTYNEDLNDIPSGTAEQPVVLFADPSGESTREPAGQVVLLGSGTGSVLTINDLENVTIDGFAVRGASGGNRAGIDIRNSSDITVRNCIVSGGLQQADGIAVLTSDDVVLVNNLIIENGRRGVRIAGGGDGSRGVRLINNTIALNGGQGVVIGTTSVGSEAELLFNIIYNNISELGVQVLATSPSVALFDADTNLVFPNRYEPSDLEADFDIHEDPLFVNELDGVFLLFDVAAGQSRTSPAVDAAFDQNFPSDLATELASIRSRTTAITLDPDTGDLDLGFHSASNTGEPIPIARTFYVRASGDDDRSSGRSPDDAFETIRRALVAADAGDTILVGPGTYAGDLSTDFEASSDSPLTFLADPTGLSTGDDPGNVDLLSSRIGFRLTGAQNIIIDGFNINGASEAGVHIRSGSSNITVRNCFIDGAGMLTDRQGDGITIEDSDDTEIINNALVFNDGNGIQIRRSDNTRLINNTIAENGVRGIRVSSGSDGSRGTFIQNNIVYFSGEVLIELDTAAANTATLRNNLVFPDAYRPLSTSELPRRTDINEDADFVSFADFHLNPSSPARNRADRGTDQAIERDLAMRTTSADDDPDDDLLDIGYHFPILPPAPTPTPER